MNLDIELDGEFQQQLEAQLASRQLPPRFYSAFRVDELGVSLLLSDRWRRIVKEVNCKILTLLCDFNRMNFGVGLEQQRWRSGSEQLTLGQKWARLWADSPRKTNKRWPYFALGLCMWCNLFFAANICYQYKYDANSIMLSKLRSFQANGSLGGARAGLELELEQNIRRARETLKLLGSAFLEWAFLIECVVLFFLPASFMYLLVNPLFYHYGQVTFVSARTILSERDECRFRAQMIMCEMRKIVDSSLQKTTIQPSGERAPYASKCHQLFRVRFGRNAGHSSLRPAMVTKLAQEHEQLMRQLKMLALEGAFSPVNRSSRHLERLALLALATCVFVSSFLIVATIILHIWMIHHCAGLGRQTELTSLRDLHAVLAHIVLLLSCYACNSFIVMVFIHNLADFFELFRCLKGLLSGLIADNKRRLAERPPGPLNGANQRPVRLLERDLLTALVQWRLFKQEFQFSKSSRNLFIVFVLLSISMPLIVRLHNSYLDDALRQVVAGVSILVVTASLTLPLPLVFVSNRCQRSFELLWSLMAQVAEWRENGFNVATPAVSCLCRELAESQHTAAHEFTCKLLFIELTVSNLVKLLFWLSLLMISLFVTSDSLLTVSLARRLNDPFGLFQLD